MRPQQLISGQNREKNRLGRHPASWAFHRSSGSNFNYCVTLKALLGFRVPLAPNWGRFGRRVGAICLSGALNGFLLMPKPHVHYIRNTSVTQGKTIQRFFFGFLQFFSFSAQDFEDSREYTSGKAMYLKKQDESGRLKAVFTCAGFLTCRNGRRS